MADVAVEIRHEGVAQGRSGIFVEKEEVLLMLDKIILPPPGRCSLDALKLQKQHSAGSAGTTMVGIVDLLYRLFW